ncbi:DUF5677 domain-containing protein [Chloroflexota bacterium]
MSQPELEQFKIKIKQGYVKLLDLLNHVLAADNYLSFGDADDNERLSIARGLTNKFIEHAVTILHLSRGINLDLPSFQYRLVDSASIYVIARASLEAFLVFHYVFYAPTTKEEQNYRYWAYKAAGIAERESAPASTKEYRQKQAAEKKELDKLRERLKSNTVFQSITDNQKRKILKGQWKLPSWREIAIDAGVSEMIASRMYSSLAGYAHSSMLSVVQMVEAHRDIEEEELVNNSMLIMNIVIANMIREYCGLFSKAQGILSKDHEGSYIVDWWIQVDRGLNELTKMD